MPQESKETRRMPKNGYKQTPLQKLKQRLAKLGKAKTDEHRKNISKAMSGRKLSDQHRRSLSEKFKGENGNNWKGGITPLNKKLRDSVEYKLWREAVLKRDRNECIWCGDKENLQADHIKQFAYYPELRFAIDNGRTLCKSCHMTTDTWGKVVTK